MKAPNQGNEMTQGALPPPSKCIVHEQKEGGRIGQKSIEISIRHGQVSALCRTWPLEVEVSADSLSGNRPMKTRIQKVASRVVNQPCV